MIKDKFQFGLDVIKICILAVILYFSSYFSFYLISKPYMEQIENGLMTTGLNTITAGFNQRIKHIEVLTNDWSYWDACYKFMSDLNQDFVRNELVDQTLINTGINMILFYNTEGDIVFKKTIPLYGDKNVDIPSQLLSHEENNSLRSSIIDVSRKNKGISGLIHTDQGDLIYAIYPVLTSDGKGPSNGEILMGRYLNNEDSDIIRNGVDLELNIRDYFNVPQNISENLQKDDVYITRDHENLVAYKLVRDTFNNPALYIEFTYPRTVTNTYLGLIKIFTLISSLGSIIVFLGLNRHFNKK